MFKKNDTSFKKAKTASDMFVTDAVLMTPDDYEFSEWYQQTKEQLLKSEKELLERTNADADLVDLHDNYLRIIRIFEQLNTELDAIEHQYAVSCIETYRENGLKEIEMAQSAVSEIKDVLKEV